MEHRKNHSLLVFAQLLKRDFYVYFKRASTYALNFIVLYPLVSIISYAYLQSKTYFGAQNVTQGTIFFAGSIVLLILSLTFELTILLLFDLENERTIDFRIVLLDPYLVLLEQIVFTTLFSFLMMIPFFPITKLILQDNFDTSNTSWPLLFLIIFLSCLACASYNLLVACALKSSNQLSHLWIRCNLPLLTLGGLWVPWYVVYEYAPGLGLLTLLNPLLYCTEGTRQALIGGTQFLPIGLCMLALLLFSLIFAGISCYLFKKKVDHI